MLVWKPLKMLLLQNTFIAENFLPEHGGTDHPCPCTRSWAVPVWAASEGFECSRALNNPIISQTHRVDLRGAVAHAGSRTQPTTCDNHPWGVVSGPWVSPQGPLPPSPGTAATALPPPPARWLALLFLALVEYGSCLVLLGNVKSIEQCTAYWMFSMCKWFYRRWVDVFLSKLF